MRILVCLLSLWLVGPTLSKSHAQLREPIRTLATARTAPARVRATADFSKTSRIVGGVLGGAAGLYLGGAAGAWLENEYFPCRCDDPGLQGMLIGAAVGLGVGIPVGVFLGDRVAGVRSAGTVVVGAAPLGIAVVFGGERRTPCAPELFR